METQTATNPVAPRSKRSLWIKWEQHEDEWLAKVYNTCPIQTIAEKLKRTPIAIYHRVRILGLSGPQNNKAKPWTVEDLEYLKTNYLALSKDEVSRALKRNKVTVYKKALELGLTKKYAPRSKLAKHRSAIILDDEAIAIARKLGNGNFVEGIRVALRREMARAKA
jgi:hypothetical protein